MDRPQPTEMLDWLKLFVGPGQIFELRAIWPNTVRNVILCDPVEAVNLAIDYNDQGANCYFTPNPLKPELLKSLKPARDIDVQRRRWFLVDIDPRRNPPDQSSSNDEKALALQIAMDIRENLLKENDQWPILADSGNGYHLCYRRDGPNDAETREDCKIALNLLSAKFSTAEVKIDTSVFNASRIWKFYGTKALKGPDTILRPHRWSRVLESENVGHSRVDQEVVGESRDANLEAELKLRLVESDPTIHEREGIRRKSPAK